MRASVDPAGRSDPAGSKPPAKLKLPGGNYYACTQPCRVCRSVCHSVCRGPRRERCGWGVGSHLDCAAWFPFLFCLPHS